MTELKEKKKDKILGTIYLSLFLRVYLCLAVYLYVSHVTCILGAHRGQKKVLGPLEMKTTVNG